MKLNSPCKTNCRTNNYGIELEFLGFKKIGLPESVTQTVFDRMKSERQVLISHADHQARRRRQKSSPPPIARPPRPLPTRRPPPRASTAKARPRPQKRCRFSSKIPIWRFSFCALTRCKQSLNQRSTLIFDERTPPFDLFQHLPTNAPSQYDHERRTRTSSRPARARRTAEDAGSQALAEALGSSFAIVKIVMVLMVVSFFCSGFFTVGPRKRRSFSVSASRLAKGKVPCSAGTALVAAVSD